MSEEEVRYDKLGRKIHPNSLAQLGHAWNSETAKQAQLLGAKVKAENAKQRKEIRASLQAWKMMKEEILAEGLSALDTLRLLLAKSIHEKDFETAAELSAKLAEYEKPKLARQEVKVEDNGAELMSDEELNAKLKSLLGSDQSPE